MAANNVETYHSCIDTDHVMGFCVKYHILDSLNPIAPLENETSASHPDMVVVYVPSFSVANARYPLTSFLEDLLEFYALDFSYVHSLGFLCATHFEISCRAYEGVPSVFLFRRFYHIRTDGDW